MTQTKPEDLARRDADHLNNLKPGESAASVAQNEIINARREFQNNPVAYNSYIQSMKSQHLSGYDLSEIEFYDSQSAASGTVFHNYDNHQVYDPNSLDANGNRKAPISADTRGNGDVQTFSNGSSRGVHRDASGNVDAVNETDANGYSSKSRLINGQWYSGPLAKPGEQAQEPQLNDDGSPKDGTTVVKAPDSTKPVATMAGEDPAAVASGRGTEQAITIGNTTVKLNDGEKPDGSIPDISKISEFHNNGDTLSRHDDGNWYFHHDAGGAFVKIDPSTIKLDKDGSVTFNQPQGLFQGDGQGHLLGVA